MPAFGAAAAGFPPITAAERTLREVPGQPEVKGVVLSRVAALHFRDVGRDANSRLEIAVRTKILTEEGKSLGELEIPHSRFMRLDNLEGRVTLPDGRTIELPKDAVFLERRSKSRKAFVTKAAFPQVEVGAIIDLKYTLYWDNFFFLEPWLFHDSLPVLHSEITYHVPPNLGVQAWGRETSSLKIQSSREQGRFGSRVKVWMDQLPALPDEPYSHPVEVLASRFMIVPLRLSASGTSLPLLESWQEVSRRFVGEIYRDFLADAGDVEKLARSTAAAAGADRRRQIEALYELVRDEIRTIPGAGGAWTFSSGADQALEARAGTSAEKALLLHAMLREIKVPSRLLWVADRTQGRPEMEVANPAFFDAMLVVIEEGGGRIFLDPGDRSLAFGHFPPFYEATPALLLDRKKPELLTMPVEPAENNQQRAELRLALDAEGKATGEGSLRHTGHYAWRFLRWNEQAEETREAWRERLATLLPGFDLHEVEVSEDLRAQEVLVKFRLEQRPEQVLGDEASFEPARPYPASQPFALPAAARLTPVLLAYAGLDSVSFELGWPPGWRVDALPRAASFDGQVGSYGFSVDHDASARRVRIERRLLRGRHEVDNALYGELRQLFEQAKAGDSQSLVLIRE